MREIRREELETQVPSQIRDFNIRVGRREDHLPKWNELGQATDRTPQGLNDAVKRIYDDNLSIIDFLKSKGFDRSGQWPIDHCKSKNWLNDYLEKQLGTREKKPETTRKTRESHFKVVLEEIVEIAGTDNLEQIARYDDKEEKITNNDIFFAVYDSLIERDNGLSRVTIREYTRTVTQFYDYLQKRTTIDHNPAAVARDSYWFPTDTTGEIITPKDHHIRAYWRATAAFEEREYIFKIIIIIFIVTGGRPSDILAPEFDAREDIEFGEDPIITFKVRKNNDETDLPDEVPLMGCCEILKKHIKKLESGTVPYVDGDGENWDGSLLPAVDDCSGSMSDQTLRNYLQEVEKVADTNYGRNGNDYIKPKAWRSRWFTEYRSALSTIRPRQKLVADDQGSSNIDLAEDAYVDNKQIRSEIRAEAREEIMSVLPDQEIPTMNEASNNSTRIQTLDDAIQRSKSEQSSSSNHAILPLVPITFATTLADMMRYKHKSDHTGQSISSVPPFTSNRRLLGTKILVMLTMIIAGIRMTTDGLLPIAYGITLVIAWAFYRDLDEMSPEAYSIN